MAKKAKTFSTCTRFQVHYLFFYFFPRSHRSIQLTFTTGDNSALFFPLSIQLVSSNRRTDHLDRQFLSFSFFQFAIPVVDVVVVAKWQRQVQISLVQKQQQQQQSGEHFTAMHLFTRSLLFSLLFSHSLIRQ